MPALLIFAVSEDPELPEEPHPVAGQSSLWPTRQCCHGVPPASPTSRLSGPVSGHGPGSKISL